MSMTATDQLKNWMTRSKLNQVEAAAVIGITYWAFNKIVIGARLPGRDNAVKIQAATGIPVGAWVSSSVDNAEPVTVPTDRK